MKRGLLLLLLFTQQVYAQKPRTIYQELASKFISTELISFTDHLKSKPDSFRLVFNPCIKNWGPSMSGTVSGDFRELFEDWIRKIQVSKKPPVRDLRIMRTNRIAADSFWIYVNMLMKNPKISDKIDSQSSHICDSLRTPPQKTLPPEAHAGSDQAFSLPQNSTRLKGSAVPHGSAIVFKRWKEIGKAPYAKILQPDQYETEITDLSPGIHEFVFEVTDENKNTGSDNVKITVSPELIILHPRAEVGPDRTLQLPEDSTILIGKGTEENGRIKSLTWEQTDNMPKAETISLKEGIIKIRKLIAGEYHFKLTVTDYKNNRDTATVRITVLEAPLPPVPHPKPDNTLLIAGTLGGLTLVAGAWYYFFLIPAWRTRKILVYFMHPEEEELVRKIMPGATSTDGYAVGHCRNSRIKKLQEAGLALFLLNTTHFRVNTPGRTRTTKITVKKGVPEIESVNVLPNKAENYFVNIAHEQPDQQTRSFPAFYIITLDAPLLPVFKKKLTDLGIEVVQYVPDNSYVIRVQDQDQLNATGSNKNFAFIRMMELYTAADTGFIVRKQQYTKAIQLQTTLKLQLDLVLHREEDSETLLAYLNQNEIQVIRHVKNNIRISLTAGTAFESALSAHPLIQAIYEYIPPVLSNNIARKLIGIEPVQNNHPRITETGDGEIIAIADTGIDLNHPDLRNRIAGTVSWGRSSTNDVSDPHGHGTHVSGSVAGDGSSSNGQIKGMATGAKIFFQSLLDANGQLAAIDLHLLEILQQAYDQGARIHNNSWGAATESRYTIDSNLVDQFIYEHPEMLVVIAAGNDGHCEMRLETEKGYISFGTVGSPATNKNGLTVGASRNKRTSGGYASATYGTIWETKFPDPPISAAHVSGDPDSMAAFSSRGPCDDDRIKPDIVAPGTDILSVKSSLAPLNQFHGGFENTAYAYLSGTSMATPILSGTAALIREYYRKKRNYPTPSAALIKATLINGTKKLTGDDAMHRSTIIPNANQGYGMLDLLYSIPNDDNPFVLEYRDSLQDPSMEITQTGQVYALKFTLTKTAWVRVCMSYTDTPARSIQNDLDLLVSFDTDRKSKWGGNKGINAGKLVAREEDRTNNTEIVRIDEAAAGDYTIKIIGYNLVKGKQGFALVVSTGDLNARFT